MRECIEVMRDAFSHLDTAGFVQPVRLVAWQPDRRGAIAAMPAWMAAPESLGAKLISVFPQNRQIGLDSHQGLVVLYDTHDGRLQAILHAGAITAIRTAAVSGLATSLLAKPDASSLAIIGSGVQAHTHLRAMLEVRAVERVRVWSRNAEHARGFATQHTRDLGIPVEAVATPREAVHEANLVCTVSASREPIVRGEWLRDGAHVNAAGAAVPGFRELDDACIERARLYVDNLKSAFAEADEIRVPIAQGRIDESHVLGTLAQLTAGACAGRVRAEDVTVFKSVGMAVEDLAAAHYVYERAGSGGRGTEVEF